VYDVTEDKVVATKQIFHKVSIRGLSLVITQDIGSSVISGKFVNPILSISRSITSVNYDSLPYIHFTVFILILVFGYKMILLDRILHFCQATVTFLLG